MQAGPTDSERFWPRRRPADQQNPAAEGECGPQFWVSVTFQSAVRWCVFNPNKNNFPVAIVV